MNPIVTVLLTFCVSNNLLNLIKILFYWKAFVFVNVVLVDADEPFNRVHGVAHSCFKRNAVHAS